MISSCSKSLSLAMTTLPSFRPLGSGCQLIATQTFCKGAQYWTVPPPHWTCFSSSSGVLYFLNGNATLSGTFHTSFSSFSLLSFLSVHPLVNLVLICPPNFWNHLSHCSCPICSSNDLHPGHCNSLPNNTPDSLSLCHTLPSVSKS